MGNALSEQYDKGRELFDQRRFKEAASCFDKEYARLTRDRLLATEEAVTLCQFFGLSLDAVGDYVRAVEVWERRRKTQEEALDITEGRGLSLTVEMLGRAMLWSGGCERAVVILERVVRMKQADDRRSYSQSLFDLAFAHFFGGSRDKALSTMSECHSVRKTLAASGKEMLPEVLCCKYVLWSFPDERDAALLDECKQMWETVAKDAIVLLIRKNLLQLGIALSKQDSDGPDRSVTVGEYCLVLVENSEQSNSLLHAEVLRAQGIALTRKWPKKACKTLMQAIEMMRQLQQAESPLFVRASIDLATAMLAAGESAAKAVSLCEQCLKIVAKETDLHARTLAVYAEALIENGDEEKAVSVTVERLEMVEKLGQRAGQASAPSTPAKLPPSESATTPQSENKNLTKIATPLNRDSDVAPLPIPDSDEENEEDEKRRQEETKAREELAAAQAKLAATEKNRLDAEAKRREAEKAKAAAAADARRKEEEEQAKQAALAAKAEMLKKEAEEKTKRDAETKRKAAEDKAKREAESLAKAEALKKDAEAKARAKAAETKAAQEALAKKEAEEKRVAEEQKEAKAKRVAEEKRVADEKRTAEEKKEAAKAKRVAEESKAAEDARLVEEKKQATAKRVVEELAEETRLAEEKKKLEDEKKAAGDEALAKEQAKKRADELRAKTIADAKARADAKRAAAAAAAGEEGIGSVIEDKDESRSADTKRIVAEAKARALDKAREPALTKSAEEAAVDANDDEAKKKEKARDEARARIAKRAATVSSPNLERNAKQDDAKAAPAVTTPTAAPSTVLNRSSPGLSTLQPPRNRLSAPPASVALPTAGGGKEEESKPATVSSAAIGRSNSAIGLLPPPRSPPTNRVSTGSTSPRAPPSPRTTSPSPRADASPRPEDDGTATSQAAMEKRQQLRAKLAERANSNSAMKKAAE